MMGLRQPCAFYSYCLRQGFVIAVFCCLNHAWQLLKAAISMVHKKFLALQCCTECNACVPAAWTLYHAQLRGHCIMRQRLLMHVAHAMRSEQHAHMLLI